MLRRLNIFLHPLTVIPHTRKIQRTLIH